MKILYFSQVSWRWIKQRPHFVSEELASLGHAVTFKAVAPVGSKKIAAKSNDLLIREVTGVRGSAKYKLSRLINGILTKIDLIGQKFDIIVLTYPFQLDFLPKRLKRLRIVYDCMDLIAEFYSDNTHARMIVKERKLCQRADAITVTSAKIKETLMERYEIPEGKITLIRNAYNSKPELVNEHQNLHLPEIKNPSLGYMGTIDHWVDFNLLFDFCSKHRDYTVYLIGPVGKGAKEKTRIAPENLVFTGEYTHDTALELIKKIDVALVPFTVTELIEGVDPVKMYEYLSLNKSVVSSYWDELSHFENSGSIFFYQDPGSFEAAVDAARAYQCEIKEAFLRENTWKARAKQFDAVLNKLLKQ